ncbi:Potassium voltage-gated channel subfamily H member 4 [Fasciola hepatica]|uniref:Potassium voltage-gated channel subfamily H member 4 n=1 Tax=Fasciola hepatica TaxID=6192 RepID=A0A4E0R2F7_FASHE|nr:Potassium voltage-gated channel subfamily H member 4 [Fasciola hepatica]
MEINLQRDILPLVLFKHSGKNDWFGIYKTPSGDFSQTVRSRCDVKSLTYCDLQSIDLAVLNEVLLQYPQFKSEFAEYLYEDLSFNIQEGAKFMDTDALLLVPVITLQLKKDNSSLCSVPPESRVFDETEAQPTQNDRQSTTNDLGNMEAGLLSLAVHSQHVSGVSSNEAIAVSHSSFSCASAANTSTGSFRDPASSSSSTSSSSSSSPSDTVRMRYYPRQSTVASGYQRKYDKGRATFSNLFTAFPSSRHKISKLSKLLAKKFDSMDGRKRISSSPVPSSYKANKSVSTRNEKRKRRDTVTVVPFTDQPISPEETHPSANNLCRKLTKPSLINEKDQMYEASQTIKYVQMNSAVHPGTDIRFIQHANKDQQSSRVKNNTVMAGQESVGDSDEATKIRSETPANMAFYIADLSEPMSSVDSHVTETSVLTGKSGSGTEGGENGWNSKCFKSTDDISETSTQGSKTPQFRRSIYSEECNSYPRLCTDSISLVLVQKQLQSVHDGMLRLERQISSMMQLIQSDRVVQPFYKELV